MERSLGFWQIIEEFRQNCRKKGWIVLEGKDLIDEREGKYHYLIPVHQIYPETFKRVTSTLYHHVKEGLSFKSIPVSYIAWVSYKLIPEDVIRILINKPELASKVALYDFNQLSSGEKKCLKMNETDSVVFQEFEAFLASRNINLTPLPTHC